MQGYLVPHAVGRVNFAGRDLTECHAAIWCGFRIAGPKCLIEAVQHCPDLTQFSSGVAMKCSRNRSFGVLGAKDSACMDMLMYVDVTCLGR